MFTRLLSFSLLLLAFSSFVFSEESSTSTSYFPSDTVFLFDEITKSSFDGVFHAVENSKYQGKWEIDVAKSHKVNDKKYLTIPKKSEHYGLFRSFGAPLSIKDEDLVVQYEVKYTSPLSCAGSYIKLLDNDAIKSFSSHNDMTDSTPYIIMFGPDKCGTNDKVHFILRYKNPVSGVWNEHHLKNPPSIENDGLTHIYTLIIRKDNSIEILIDGESKKKGNLLEDFEPSIIPPKLIDDPTDFKPKDWVDDEFINDPDATKPDDWDENQPEEIIDPNDTIPEGWLVDEPDKIPDPEANIPEDWDVDEDGVWEAPLVPNPKCTIGCGQWSPRMINNPLYKGKWYPPKIKNPDYIGPWKARQIDNPNYFEDDHPHNLPAIGALSFDLWTIDEGIGFGNILISKNEKDAFDYINLVWKSHHELELSTLPKPDKWKNVTETIQNFLSLKYKDIPVALIIIAGIVGSLIPLILICGCCRSGRSSSEEIDLFENESKKESKDELVEESKEELVEESKDQLVEPVAPVEEKNIKKSLRNRKTKKET